MGVKIYTAHVIMAQAADNDGAEKNDAEQSKKLGALYGSLPELPLPLATLTEASMVNPFTIMQNKAIQRVGASKWQRQSMVTRRAEDFVHELLLRDAAQKVDNQTPTSVLAGLDAVLGPNAGTDPWAALGHGQCAMEEDCEAWQTVSASSFFWDLFVDLHVNEDLDEASMLVIGNAFLFAQWKEQVEYKALGALFGDFTAEAYALLEQIESYLEPESQGLSGEGDFEKFVTRQMPAQTLPVNRAPTQEQIRAMLQISPWCGLMSVLSVLKKSLGEFNRKTGEYKRRLRIASASLKARVAELWFAVPGEAGYDRCLACQHHASKRAKEHRFRLAVLVQCVLPHVAKNTGLIAQELQATAKRLVTERDDFVVSYKGTVSKGLEAVSREILAQTPSLQSVLDAQVPVLSHAAVDFLSLAWADLWSRVAGSQVVNTLVLVSLASGGGLFVSHQRWLIRALASVLRLVAQELLHVLI